jgi:hypothetical protein
VRLVGAPPTSIGKFGSDNWVLPAIQWFSLFRIYANKKPSSKNIQRQCALYSKTLLTYFAWRCAEDDFTLVLVIQEKPTNTTL